MKKILIIVILINLLSCKESKIDNTKKFDYVSVDDEGNAKKEQTVYDEIEEIGYLYQPERMEREEIKKSAEKNDYQYTLTNSDLLDKDIENLEIHSRKIVSNYYNFLVKINVPFNYDNIIVKIVHRNGEEDIFRYSENEIRQILK